ncbi:techylectin-5A-like [Gigantopelta aegis]|uniref:techylectin-5A-like n=1 Tax=Gigantopelta aegis TaxID=1735272 RepID=UPI001B889FA5|nr:techylectin-5A-like [Gigantopelta aegis]
MDGSENFYRDWNYYRDGFGDLEREFWFGNTNIQRLTSQGHYDLRVDLEAFNGSTVYAQYSDFSLASERDYFQLNVGAYSGNSGNGLGYHNGHNFTTYDRDYNPANSRCVKTSLGGWWYHDCHASNLNGLYLTDNPIRNSSGISWSPWLGVHYSLKRTVMKIRPTPKIITR